jgi:hypothetical protein
MNDISEKFIDDRDRKIFETENRFFNRKIKEENNTVKKDKGQEVISFIQKKYDVYNKETANFQAIWISCRESDGVSWLCEKIYDYFANKKV